MTMPTRSLLASLCLCFLWIAACGGGTGAPTAPSSTGGTGAMIAGTVSGAAPAGLTVAVTGTSLSAAVESTGNFQMAGVPSGNVQLQFRSTSVNATAQIANVANDELVQIQVQLNGSTASIVSEVRSAGKVLLCHRTESGTYQSIDVSVNAEPAHRAHGDAKIGEAVPGDPTKVFDQNCRPTGASVSIRKFTNGQDANDAPGPSINVRLHGHLDVSGHQHGQRDARQHFGCRRSWCTCSLRQPASARRSVDDLQRIGCRDARPIQKRGNGHGNVDRRDGHRLRPQPLPRRGP